MNHFIADCPKKKKRFSYNDNNNHADNHKKKNTFYNKKDKGSSMLKKAINRAYMASLSDVDLSASDDYSSSDEEEEKPKTKRKDKDFTGLCFMAKGGENNFDTGTEEVLAFESLTCKVAELIEVIEVQDKSTKRLMMIKRNSRLG